MLEGKKQQGCAALKTRGFQYAVFFLKQELFGELSAVANYMILMRWRNILIG